MARSAQTTPSAVRKAIENRINNGIYKPGDPLPTQVELAAELGVITKVISEVQRGMVYDGWLVRQSRAPFYRVAGEYSNGSPFPKPVEPLFWIPHRNDSRKQVAFTDTHDYVLAEEDDEYVSLTVYNKICDIHVKKQNYVTVWAGKHGADRYHRQRHAPIICGKFEKERDHMSSHDDIQMARMARAYNYACRAQLDVKLLDAEIGLQNEVEGLRQHLGARIAKQYLVWLFGEPVEPTPKEVLVELLEELRPESTA